MNLEEFITGSFRDVRSSNRTDNLHTALVNLLLQQRPELSGLTIKYEYRYPDCYGGTFQVDIAFFAEDGTCPLVVLAKALNSSVGKNIKNYGNCTIGEAARIMHSDTPPAEVLFITVAPRWAPIFTASGEVKAFDDVVRKVKETNPQRVLSIQYNGSVKSHYIFYDIIDFKSKVNKGEFETIEFENLIIPSL